MGDTQTQRLAFEFLLDRFHTQEPFTKEAFHQAIPDWKKNSFDTYWSKQIKRLVAPTDNKSFIVTEAFRPYANWGSFRRNIATQVRRIYSDYTSLTYDNLIIYEFFMPLTNEGHLRTTLDALFYKNTIQSRLRNISHEKMIEHFPIRPDESHEAYLDRVCRWCSEQFGGYSVTHVNGRFRAGPLATMTEVADYQSHGDRYLIDETTAVVRFIFPCGEPLRRKTPVTGVVFEDDEVYDSSDDEPKDAATIRWFFRVLFVQSILQVVNGEDEIWMIESGMRNRLHIWRVEEP